ncbi:hypothetical protein Agabi119p4_6869 [Agaricus bisporus var. burnettii]|uniref:Carboxypeptidase n=1 Tax=Agaricus bisporus var. burnettii TaxID=192524 RepID=A0A8H7F0C5_AGABI|nr:hypothetical protein Agabi119p4_6869 [Agaricus bisporus var. burnettii]
MKICCVLAIATTLLGVKGDTERPEVNPSGLLHQNTITVQTERTPGRLRSLVENSGICETTSGVYQASGYGDISYDGSLWFWFFAARKNPDTAPLVLWFNGGPGESSMAGLMQEHGPCRINNDSHTVSPNEYSWNERVNMLYIDQPVGVGFSTGNRTISTTAAAAADVWNFTQIWLSDPRFLRYQNRDLGIWTESYGGHYGPAFASYFLSQNEAIASGQLEGIPLNLKTMGVGNGLVAPLIQYQGILDYASNNTYRTFNSSDLSLVTAAWEKPKGCKDQIATCYNNGTDAECSNAQEFCNLNVVGPLAQNINPYYTPNPPTDPYPHDPEAYLNSMRSSIGAETEWFMMNDSVAMNFAATGDWMRDFSRDVERVINAGVRTLFYNGDADLTICYQGFQLMLDALNTTFSEEYRRQNFQDFVVSGQAAGLYKNAGTFSYVRVFGAGHRAAAYGHGSLKPGQAAFQMFNQIMANQSIGDDGSGPNSDHTSHDGSSSLKSWGTSNISLLTLLMSWVFL